ncbi:hypothetical protein ACWIGI_23675 [Nocardia sp. NPDC055321]
MRLTRLAPLLGAFTIATLVGTATLTPLAAPAQAEQATETLADVAISDVNCATGATTFDDVITAAATALRTVVPVEQQSAYDQQVQDFRQTVAATRVHRNVLPVDPGTLGAKVEDIDDPIVTYLVNGLDAVRTGRMDTTVSVSELTLEHVVEVFLLANRIVKIPTQMLTTMIPRVGSMLVGMVGSMFKGVHRLGRSIQDRIGDTCNPPNVYAPLDLSFAEEETRSEFPVPAELAHMANQLVLADESCTPAGELNTAAVLERTRAFLAASDQLPFDLPTLHAATDALHAFLRDHHVAKPLILRPTAELGAIPAILDYGPLTLLTNLGFDIYEGKAHHTVPLSEVTVENSLDLAYVTADTASLLLSLGSMVAGMGGVGSEILTPVTIARVLAFAPMKYGWPVMRGVLRSMCAAE